MNNNTISRSCQTVASEVTFGLKFPASDDRTDGSRLTALHWNETHTRYLEPGRDSRASERNPWEERWVFL
jgi:hypothetical protein